MSIHPDGRQYPLLAIVEFELADLPTTDVTPVLELPQNSVILGIDLIIDTVFNDGSADTFDIGDADDPDRYTASPVDVTGLGVIADVTPTGYVTTADDPEITIEYVGASADATTGAGRLVVEYYVAERRNENQG
jgi:hypothetical protein